MQYLFVNGVLRDQRIEVEGDTYEAAGTVDGRTVHQHFVKVKRRNGEEVFALDAETVLPDKKDLAGTKPAEGKGK